MNEHMSLPRGRIVLVVPSAVIADTLVASGALDGLRDRFAVEYLCSADVAERPDLSPRRVLAPASLRNRLLTVLDIHFWYHALFVYLRRLGIRSHRSFKIAYLKPYQRWVHRVLALPVLAGFCSWLDRRVVFPFDPPIVHYLETAKPDLVIIPGSAMDSYSHFVARSAERVGIPVLMIVSHWDYFSKKGLMRVRPQRIYVWGEDMRNLAVHSNGLDEAILRVVGAPHFEKYLRKGHRNLEARKRLDLPVGGRILLFAGTSAPYDELAVLKRLNDHLARSGREDVSILYRPHPRAWKRRLLESVDTRSLSRVLLDDASADAGTSESHYLNLMAAVDGIVSPFSTMILEGALCGRPAFCIGFGDGVNRWDFAEANHSEHIAILSGRSWMTPCADAELLETKFEEFLAGFEQTDLGERVRAEIRHTIYYDNCSYAMRLLNAIRTDFAFLVSERRTAAAVENDPDSSLRVVNVKPHSSVR
jgi:hypothetical protein